MTEVILQNKTESGTALSATFSPDKGMNLLSFKWGEIELIDQSTKQEFEERRAGLGPLSGPHFLRRHPATIKPLPPGVTYPHFPAIEKRGETDPFAHGISRYAPWKFHHEEGEIFATLSGKEEWNGVTLADLEGQMFQMGFKAVLTKTGLKLNLSVVSDTDSMVGIHYYWNLPGGKGTVRSAIKESYLKDGEKHPIPADWVDGEPWKYVSHLDEALDYTFHPYFNPLEGNIVLETDRYDLITNYKSPSQENGWQLYHPKGASFVCIEPLSSYNPHKPNLTVSSVEIEITLVEKS